MATRFELNDTLYVDAIVPPTETVFLWLGVSSTGRYISVMYNYFNNFHLIRLAY